MAKRFIDTGLFDDEWFADLNKDCKLFWVYYLTKCDHAGLLKYNKKLIGFQTGLDSLDTILGQLGSRIVTVNEHLLFCPKFIAFQYPDFPESKFAAAKSALELLIKNGVWDVETNNFRLSFNCPPTVSKELPNSYGNGNGIGNVSGKGKKLEKFSSKTESYQTGKQAFEDIQQNEGMVERMVRTVQRAGYNTCDAVTVMKAVGFFISREEAKPDFTTRTREEFKSNLVNWISKYAKTLDQYA